MINYYNILEINLKGFSNRWNGSVTRENVLLHAKTLCYTWKRSVTRENVLLHVKTFYYIWKRSVTRENVLLHVKTFYYTWKRSVTRENVLLHGANALLDGEGLSVCKRIRDNPNSSQRQEIS